MTRGAHIKVNRTGYDHHGIDVGGRGVIHYTKRGGGGVVARDSRARFEQGNPCLVVAEPRNEAHADEVVARAEDRLHKRGYNLLSNNCEHFARECFYGMKSSAQVESLVVASPGLTLGGLVGTVAGSQLASSMVTLLGSKSLGSIALSLGLVSAPVLPGVVGGAMASVVFFGSIWAFSRSRTKDDYIRMAASSHQTARPTPVHGPASRSTRYSGPGSPSRAAPPAPASARGAEPARDPGHVTILEKDDRYYLHADDPAPLAEVPWSGFSPAMYVRAFPQDRLVRAYLARIRDIKTWHQVARLALIKGREDLSRAALEKKHQEIVRAQRLIRAIHCLI